MYYTRISWKVPKQNGAYHSEPNQTLEYGTGHTFQLMELISPKVWPNQRSKHTISPLGDLHL